MKDIEKTLEEQAIISKHMSDLGKKAGAVNKRKGSSYFKWVRAHGRQKNNKVQTKTSSLDS